MNKERKKYEKWGEEEWREEKEEGRNTNMVLNLGVYSLANLRVYQSMISINLKKNEEESQKEEDMFNKKKHMLVNLLILI